MQCWPLACTICSEKGSKIGIPADYSEVHIQLGQKHHNVSCIFGQIYNAGYWMPTTTTLKSLVQCTEAQRTNKFNYDAYQKLNSKNMLPAMKARHNYSHILQNNKVNCMGTTSTRYEVEYWAKINYPFQGGELLQMYNTKAHNWVTPLDLTMTNSRTDECHWSVRQQLG